MANPIASTPLLTGKYADTFVENLDKAPSDEKKDFLEEAKSVYKIIKENSEH